MTTFEKSIVMVVTAIAFIMLIAILVLSTVTAMEVHRNPLSSYNSSNTQQPRFHVRPNGDLEIDVPSGNGNVDLPSKPRYPRGSNTRGSNTRGGSNIGDGGGDEEK